MTKDNRYCVFISYAWTEERKQWVYNLAKRLMTQNGIVVKLDLFDLEPGQEKNYFMEQMTNEEVDHVLIICDKNYMEKANVRDGGVGIETQIITPEIFKKTSQTKFIPIVAEIGEEFTSYIPTYLRSRICIDMSSIDAYEEGYIKILRQISKQPEFMRPELSGSIPDFSKKKDSIVLTTAAVRGLKQAILEDKSAKIEYYISQFMSGLIEEMKKHKLLQSDFTEPFDDIIYNEYIDMTPLRNDYIEFIDSLCVNKSIISRKIEDIKSLLEKMLIFNDMSIEDKSSYRIQYDHFRLFSYEIFLYTIALLIHHKAYSEANFLLGTVYFYSNLGNDYDDTISVFISNPIDSIDDFRNKRLGTSKLSLSTDMIINRSMIANKNYRDDLITADLLAFYFQTARNSWWFPRTYPYLSYGKVPRIFKAMKSKREFESIKGLFGIDNIEDMKEWIKKATPKQTIRYSGGFGGAPSINNFIKPEELCQYE